MNKETNNNTEKKDNELKWIIILVLLVIFTLIFNFFIYYGRIKDLGHDGSSLGDADIFNIDSGFTLIEDRSGDSDLDWLLEYYKQNGSDAKKPKGISICSFDINGNPLDVDNGIIDISKFGFKLDSNKNIIDSNGNKVNLYKLAGIDKFDNDGTPRDKNGNIVDTSKIEGKYTITPDGNIVDKDNHIIDLTKLSEIYSIDDNGNPLDKDGNILDIFLHSTEDSNNGANNNINNNSNKTDGKDNNTNNGSNKTDGKDNNTNNGSNKTDGKDNNTNNGSNKTDGKDNTGSNQEDTSNKNGTSIYGFNKDKQPLDSNNNQIDITKYPFNFDNNKNIIDSNGNIVDLNKLAGIDSFDSNGNPKDKNGNPIDTSKTEGKYGITPDGKIVDKNGSVVDLTKLSDIYSVDDNGNPLDKDGNILDIFIHPTDNTSYNQGNNAGNADSETSGDIENYTGGKLDGAGSGRINPRTGEPYKGYPEDTITKAEQDKRDRQEGKKIFVDDAEVVYEKNTKINIFNNDFYKDKIAPGVYGKYDFAVHNNASFKAKYFINMTETSQDKVNMKYRLMKNGAYVIGDENNWVSASELTTDFNTIRSRKVDNYTLEWKWFDDDPNDIIAGINHGTYNLEISIYIEQIVNK